MTLPLFPPLWLSGILKDTIDEKENWR